MKYYEKLVSMACFSKRNLTEICGSDASAKWIIWEYQKKGLIERVKRDLYVVISLETLQPIASRYQIASNISKDATVSFHSAFEFYGYANQVFYDVYVISNHRFRDFEYENVFYRRMESRVQKGITEVNGIRVTSLERTVIDCIHEIEKAGGLEELLRCINLVPTLDESALLACLNEYQIGFLYQKTGYILSVFADQLRISESFFNICKEKLPKGKSYLLKDKQNLIWNGEWNLYVPENLLQIINKGVLMIHAI